MVLKNYVKLPNLFSSEPNPENLLKEIHSFEGRLAEHITSLAGSVTFVNVHIIWFSAWITANQGWAEPYLHPFDLGYGLLTMIVSLEAIFLATFIMITQNRQALIETYRDLTEEEEIKEAEEEVEDIQKDLEDIKKAMEFIQKKIGSVESKTPNTPTL